MYWITKLALVVLSLLAIGIVAAALPHTEAGRRAQELLGFSTPPEWMD